jgi:hypothetical protein
VDAPGYPARKGGVIFVTRLPGKFDDSVPSTRGLYYSPSQRFFSRDINEEYMG